MKIMLFGASGYLAGFVAEKLVADGHELVQVYRSSSARMNQVVGSEALVCEQTSDARALVVQVNPDVVLNMANFFSKSQEPDDVQKFADVNTAFVAEIAFGCCETAAVLFHIGSAWQAQTFQEGDPSLGAAYGLFKGLAGRIIDWFRASFGLQAMTLNLYDTYGPNDPRGKIVQFLVGQVGADTPLEISGGEQILELVYAADVADAIAAGMELISDTRSVGEALAPEPFWCYPDTAVTLRDIVDAVNFSVPEPIAVQWGARPYRVGEKFEREIEGKPRIPGWTQRIHLREGIAKVLEARC